MSMNSTEFKKQVDDLFKEIDTNKNGYLSKEECHEFAKQMHEMMNPNSNKPMDEAKFEAFWPKLDKNHD